MKKMLYQFVYAGIFASALLPVFFEVNWKHMSVLLITIMLMSVIRLLDRRQQIYAAIIGMIVFLSLCREIRWEEEIYTQLAGVFLLAAISYFAQILVQKSVILKVIPAVVAGGWLFYVLFWKQQVSKMAVTFFILYIVLSTVEWIRAGWKKMRDENTYAFILGIMPFLLIYVILLAFMPARKEPYSWQWVKDIYRSAEEKVAMYTENLWHSKREYFDNAVSGFSEEGVLFPNITRTDRQLMTLETRNQKAMPVYLAGKVFNSFNGREWQNHITDSEPVRSFDVLETIYALESYPENDKQNYYRNIQMKIDYQYFHTNYLLAPTKAWKIEGQKTEYDQNGADLLLNRRAGYGTEYLLRFFQMNMDREEWYRFLMWDYDEDEEALEKAVRQYSIKSVSIVELNEYREKMKERYLPETDISPEVEEWILNVTADAQTDVEKLKSIENALAGMAYNINAGKLPETVTDEKSFLDYFILEKREGYCAHFATAFVLLARAEGFPARYVQGFCIPTVSGGETPVYSNMAHSWPEVYIEKKGWIPFEPTPGFGSNRYTVWDQSVDVNPKIPKLQEDISEVALPEEELWEVQAEISGRWMSYLFRAVLILVIGIFIAFVVDWLSERYREKRRTLSEKYRLTVLQNLRILGMLGYGREHDQTYHELVERIRQGDAVAEEIPWKFIETYENSLYGTLKIDEQIWEDVLAEREKLHEILKRKKGKKYLIYKVRLYFAKRLQK